MNTVAPEILSVTEYTKKIRVKLENSIPASWITGEVSNLRIQSSGHAYFTLKDEGSQLSCVLFRGDAIRQSVQLQEGRQIIIFGDISVYEPRGGYQLIVRILMESGLGKLQLAFERLKQKLAQEGLFAPERKKAIPLFPKTIAFITSPTGAAIQDFISILKRRNWGGKLYVLESLVQGEQAPDQLRNQLKKVLSIKEIDLLVIGRGGGSLEDLWAFNDEALVRDLASCSIPTISAVGHEIDFTLCDFVADLRAETPSAAAEIITRNFYGHVKDLQSLGHRLKRLSPGSVIEQLFLRLDDLQNRSLLAIKEKLFQYHEGLSRLQLRLSGVSPKALLRYYEEQLKQLKTRLVNAGVSSQLKRGFALIKNTKGHLLKSKKDLIAGEELRIQFEDGDVLVKVL